MQSYKTFLLRNARGSPEASGAGAGRPSGCTSHRVPHRSPRPATARRAPPPSTELQASGEQAWLRVRYPRSMTKATREDSEPGRRTRTRGHADTRRHARTHADTQTPVQTHADRHRQTRTRGHTQKHADASADTRGQTRTHVDRHGQTRTDTDTRRRQRGHTRTHAQQRNAGGSHVAPENGPWRPSLRLGGKGGRETL